MLKKLFFCSSLFWATFLLLSIAPAPLQAHTPRQPQTTIQITYVGDWPEEAKTALQYSADIWEGLIAVDRTITVNANWSIAPDDTTSLAQGTSTEYIQGNETPYPDASYPSCLFGVLTNNNRSCDFSLQINGSRNDWYFGLNGQPGSNQYDFVTVTMRAFGQAFGFNTFGYADTVFQQGTWSNQLYSIYDRLLFNHLGQRLTDQKLFPNYSVALLQQFTSNNLFFTGPLAISENNNNPVKIHAPLTWDYAGMIEGHRSLIYLDEATYPAGTPNSLMTPIINPGEAIHHPGRIGLAVLYDLGWPQPPVPPEIPFLPSHMMLPNTTHSFDLWAYVNDPNHEDNTLQFTLVSSSEANAGVALRDNRFIDIEPATDWTGSTVVEIQATNPDNLSTTQTFEVFVVTEIHQQFLPLLQR